MRFLLLRSLSLHLPIYLSSRVQLAARGGFAQLWRSWSSNYSSSFWRRFIDWIHLRKNWRSSMTRGAWIRISWKRKREREREREREKRRWRIETLVEMELAWELGKNGNWNEMKKSGEDCRGDLYIKESERWNSGNWKWSFYLL